MSFVAATLVPENQTMRETVAAASWVLAKVLEAPSKIHFPTSEHVCRLIPPHCVG